MISAAIATTPQTDRRETGLNRLRRLCGEQGGTWFYEGKIVGTTWAEETATANELGNLREWRKDFMKDKSTRYVGRIKEKVTRCEWQATQMTGADVLNGIYRNHFAPAEEYPLRVPEAEFWLGILPIGYPDRNDKLRDDDFIKGFVEGALQVWAQV